MEYTALIEPDMSRITLIIGSIIFTPDTDDGFGGFPSPPETSARKPYAQFWEFSTSTEDSWLAMRLTCTLCAFARKPFRSLDFERQSAQNRSNRTKSAIVCSAPSISNSLRLRCTFPKQHLEDAGRAVMVYKGASWSAMAALRRAKL